MDAVAAPHRTPPDDRSRRSGAERDALVDELVRLRSVVNAAEARCAEIVADLSAASEGHPLECRSVVQFLSWQAGLAPVAAKALDTVGQRLAELPSLRDAAMAGEVSVWQARAVASAAEDDEEASRLLEVARHGTCAQLETACRHLRRCRAAGDDADAAAHRARRLRTWWTVHRTLRIDGELDAEAATVLHEALERAGGEVPDDAVDRADEPHSAQRADALDVLARAYLDRDPADRASSGPPPGHVAVHVGVGQLVALGHGQSPDAARGADLDAGGSSVGGDPTPTTRCRLGWNGPGVAESLLRRLACDSTIQAVLCSDDSDPLALGRRHRVVGGALRRALFARDGGRCAAPGCDAARFLHAHHIVHWADGGATDLDNLVLLCHWHHRLAHDGLLIIATTPDGPPRVRRTRPLRVPGLPPVHDVATAAGSAGITPALGAARSRWCGDRIDWACFDAAYLDRPSERADPGP